MYDLINQHAEQIVGATEVDLIKSYEWLCQNPTHDEYQTKFRNFWAMGGAHLNARFYPVYFDLLNSERTKQPSEDFEKLLADIARKLYDASEDSNGRKSIQFSFATKLVHTLDPHLPVYDSNVAEFFFFAGPTKNGAEERLGEYINFYKFLIGEYERVIRDGLLMPAMTLFRSKCAPQHWTDEKVIDSLIWAFVPLLRKRGIQYA